MQGTMPDARRRGIPHAAWMDNINTWRGLPVVESIRMTEDRGIWRKYVGGVANPRIEDGLTEQTVDSMISRVQLYKLPMYTNCTAWIQHQFNTLAIDFTRTLNYLAMTGTVGIFTCHMYNTNTYYTTANIIVQCYQHINSKYSALDQEFL